MKYRRKTPQYYSNTRCIKQAPFLSLPLKRPVLLGKSETSTKESNHYDDISVKILKENVNFLAEYISIF